MKTNTKGWNAKSNAKSSNANRIHNLIIVDQSGSMTSIYNQALSGINETLNTIREAAKRNPEMNQSVTLVFFDSEAYKVVFDSVDIRKTRLITKKDYSPCACTPLYDAMGKALTDLNKKVRKGDAVLVTIITDGYENCSSEYSAADIKSLVDSLKEKGWIFTYIGANQDAFKVGITLSIENCLNFEASEVGTKQMFAKEKKARDRFYDRCCSEPQSSELRAKMNCDYFDE